MRMLRGAGVLEFRIAVRPGERTADEPALRRQLSERGPDGVEAVGVNWFPLNKKDDWFDDVEGLRLMEADAPSYFAERYGLVVEPYEGRYYALLHDRPGLRLTEAEGDWSLSDSYPASDNLGRPAVGFEMNPRGAQLLGELTGNNVGELMAVQLDGNIYTAPNLIDRISTHGIIQGTFSPTELSYLIKTLNAGSLQARLSDRPISVTTLAPELGADNLRKGLTAAWISLVLVGVFMVFYYFTSGFVAMIALLSNAIIILGAMSLNRAAFTLPGIAGIVLTFGMAVDANVLIYERIREELLAGNDLKHRRFASRTRRCFRPSSTPTSRTSSSASCSPTPRPQEVKRFRDHPRHRRRGDDV